MFSDAVSKPSTHCRVFHFFFLDNFLNFPHDFYIGSIGLVRGGGMPPGFDFYFIRKMKTFKRWFEKHVSWRFPSPLPWISISRLQALMGPLDPWGPCALGDRRLTDLASPTLGGRHCYLNLSWLPEWSKQKIKPRGSEVICTKIDVISKKGADFKVFYFRTTALFHFKSLTHS
jgi:hypothetical protein